MIRILTSPKRFDEPPLWVQNTLNMAMGLRKRLIRNLFLPRPEIMRVLWFTLKADSVTGRYHLEQYIGHPWYIKPTMARRWSPKSCLLWLTGGYVPSETYREYRPEGYKIAEIGPVSLEGKDIDEMEIAKVGILRAQKCPFLRTSQT